MPRISKGGSKIGGVRSPMAQPGHGLVRKGNLHPSTGAGASRSGIGGSPSIRSPYNKGAIVGRNGA